MHPESKSSLPDVRQLPQGEMLAIHPLAQKLPRPHVASLRESIKQVGQTDPGKVVLGEDGERLLIDGVTRLAICRDLELPFRYEIIELPASGIANWILQNFRASGRELNDSQRLAAASIAKELAVEAEARMKAGKSADPKAVGRTHEKVAELLNLKPSRVRSALAVAADAELSELVSQHGTAISVAIKIGKLTDRSVRSAALAAAAKKDRRELARLFNGHPQIDTAGVPLPPRLAPVFEKTASVRSLHAQTEKLRAAVAELAYSDVGRLLDGARLDTALKEVAATLADAAPAFVCPVCAAAGDSCRVCDGSGWLSRAEYDAAHRVAFANYRSNSAVKVTQ